MLRKLHPSAIVLTVRPNPVLDEQLWKFAVAEPLPQPETWTAVFDSTGILFWSGVFTPVLAAVVPLELADRFEHEHLEVVGRSAAALSVRGSRGDVTLTFVVGRGSWGILSRSNSEIAKLVERLAVGLANGFGR